MTASLGHVVRGCTQAVADSLGRRLEARLLSMCFGNWRVASLETKASDAHHLLAQLSQVHP